MPSGDVLASGAGPKLFGEFGRGVTFGASVGAEVWHDEGERGRAEEFVVITEDGAGGDDGTGWESVAEEESSGVGEVVLVKGEVKRTRICEAKLSSGRL